MTQKEIMDKEISAIAYVVGEVMRKYNFEMLQFNRLPNGELQISGGVFIDVTKPFIDVVSAPTSKGQ